MSKLYTATSWRRAYKSAPGMPSRRADTAHGVLIRTSMPLRKCVQCGRECKGVRVDGVRLQRQTFCSMTCFELHRQLTARQQAVQSPSASA